MHSQDCYTTITQCTHIHDETCGYTEADPAACTHQCTEASGCVTQALLCPHVHGDACGYAPAVEASPCAYTCEACTQACTQASLGVAPRWAQQNSVMNSPAENDGTTGGDITDPRWRRRGPRPD